MTQLVQCAPNFSEGRDSDVMQAIVEAVAGTSGVRLADWSADTDHHRLVVTFVGPPAAVKEAALAASAAAIARVDLRRHAGIHPRLGAVDVLPIVPLSEITLAECGAWATDIARELAARFDLPVFLYEASSPEGRSLPLIRKEAFGAIAPDFGPPVPHPTAGAAVVGARNPLIAYNINLATSDLRIAKRIARELREGAGGLIGVRGLGLYLESRGITQVSLNITRTEDTPLQAVFRYVERRAKEMGTTIVESEVIGALPGFAAFGLIADALQAPSLTPAQVLWENWPGR